MNPLASLITLFVLCIFGPAVVLVLSYSLLLTYAMSEEWDE